MKKRIYLLFVALLAVSSFTLVSCSSDDDDDILSGSIVGTWKWDIFSGVDIDDDDPLYDFWGTEYVQFQKDGTFIEVDIYGGEVEVTKGQWVQSGNTITVSASGYITTTFTITNLTDTDLTLVTLGIPMSFERVDDSEIEQYLD